MPVDRAADSDVLPVASTEARSLLEMQYRNHSLKIQRSQRYMGVASEPRQTGVREWFESAAFEEGKNTANQHYAKKHKQKN